jgi:hypothetical protein
LRNKENQRLTFGRRNQICCEQSHFKDDKLEADDRREERMGGDGQVKNPRRRRGRREMGAMTEGKGNQSINQ